MAREVEKWMPMERNFEDMSAVTYSHFVCSADKLFILNPLLLSLCIDSKQFSRFISIIDERNDIVRSSETKFSQSKSAIEG